MHEIWCKNRVFSTINRVHTRSFSPGFYRLCLGQNWSWLTCNFSEHCWPWSCCTGIIYRLCTRHKKCSHFSCPDTLRIWSACGHRSPDNRGLHCAWAGVPHGRYWRKARGSCGMRRPCNYWFVAWITSKGPLSMLCAPERHDRLLRKLKGYHAVSLLSYALKRTGCSISKLTWTKRRKSYSSDQ